MSKAHILHDAPVVGTQLHLRNAKGSTHLSALSLACFLLSVVLMDTSTSSPLPLADSWHCSGPGLQGSRK